MSSLKCREKFKQRAHAEAGAALGTERAVALRKGRTGNVQVRPPSVADEFLQDQRRRDGAAVGAANVFHIGNAAFNHLTIFLDQRQLPKFFAAFSPAANQIVRQSLVVAEYARHLAAQGNHARARQGRQIDHVVRLLLRRERQRIGENKAPLGVRVQNLDGLAIEITDHVARLLRVLTRQIIRCRHVAGDLDVRIQLGQTTHSGDYGSATGHVELHGPMDLADLSDNPPESNVIPLPMSATFFVALPAGL